MNFVDRHCNSRPNWELPPVPFNKLLILALYFNSGDEHFLSSIVSCADLIIEMDVGSFTKDDSCTIAMSLLGCEASQEKEDNAFLYVEEMWRESSRNEIAREFHEKFGGISRITFTVSTGYYDVSPCNSSY